MTTEPAAGPDHETDAGPQTQPARGPVVGWLALIVLAALLVGSVAFAINEQRKHRTEQAQSEDRKQALSVAEQFTLRLDTMSYKDLDGYQKKLSSLLTPKMRSDFDQTYKGFNSVYTALQFSSTGDVRAAGVADIDADSATVLVIHDVKVTSKGCVQPPYKRMSVQLRKIQGKWLVDNFNEDVPGCQSTSTTGGGQ